MERGVNDGGKAEDNSKRLGDVPDSCTRFSAGAESRELPAVRKILAQVEPKRIIRVMGEVFGVAKDELLRKGYKGVARGVPMELLYRYGGLNQREIGELMGIDYSAVSVMRERLSALKEKDRHLSAEIGRVKERLKSNQE